jgi:uncharacterized protein (TIGR02996 family)
MNIDPKELARFMRTICADPADDYPRLVLADRLDDVGDCNHAELVRLQVQLARIQPRPLFTNCSSFSFFRNQGSIIIYGADLIEVGDRFDLWIPEDERRDHKCRGVFHGLRVTSMRDRLSRSTEGQWLDWTMDAGSVSWEGTALQKRIDALREILAVDLPLLETQCASKAARTQA